MDSFADAEQKGRDFTLFFRRKANGINSAQRIPGNTLRIERIIFFIPPFAIIFIIFRLCSN
jgi:hypothetical protein